jgi:hypothetical protein
VIELSFLYGSGMEAGQRLGRLAYEVAGADRPGEHHILMTPDEYERHNKRLMIYYQWGLDVSVQVPDTGNVRAALRLPAQRPSPKRSAALQARSRAAGRSVATEAREPKPPDETDQVLRLKPVAARMAEAKDKVGQSTAPYLMRAFRLCFNAAFSPAEITEGKGLVNAGNISRYRSACKALREVGLFVEDSAGRFIVNQDELARLRALAQKFSG